MNANVDVDVKVAGDLNAARAQCGEAPVKEVVLANLTDKAIAGANLFVYAENGELIEQRVRVSDISPKGSCRVPCATLRANMPKVQVSEEYTTVVRAELRYEGRIVGEGSALLEVMPFNHWDASSPQSLAAFCIPNTPALKALRNRTAQIVEAKTGSPALDGYNGGEQRVCALARAAFEACAELGIAYAKAPASFGAGQRIRLANELVGGGTGTCIDLAFLYASCLESMRLNAVIAITSSHAFAGVRLANEQGQQSVVRGQDACHAEFTVRNSLFVECTMFTKGKAQVTFSDAVESARKTFDTDDTLEYVVDIAAARRAGIRPLPQVLGAVRTPALCGPGRAPASDVPLAPSGAQAPSALDEPSAPSVPDGPGGSSALGEPSAASSSSVGAQLAPAVGLAPAMRPVPTRDTLHEWLGRLLDLSLRNPALNMKLGSRAVTLDMPCADAVRLLDAGEVCEVKGVDDCVLATLDRASKRSLAETGAPLLSLGLGAVRWRRADEASSDDSHTAPLVLAPAELVLDRITKRLSLRVDFRNASVNRALVELVRSEFGVLLPDFSDEFSAGEPQGVFNRALAAAREMLAPAETWSIDDSLTVLGLFPQVNAVLHGDLLNHAAQAPAFRSRIVAGLASGKLEDASSAERRRVLADRASEVATTGIVPLAADDSQLKAIALAAAGESFVMDGPPGTGKSQTIVNMVVDAAVRGKSVLVVSEKAAALDVVRNRLRDLKLDGMCLELYGSLDKAAVLGRLDAALRDADEGPRPVDGPDAHDSWVAAVHDVRKAQEPLDRYAQALESPVLAGLTLRDAVARLASVQYAADIALGDRVFAKVHSEADVREVHRLIDLMAAAATALSEGSYACVAEHPLAFLSPEQCEAQGLIEAFDDAQMWEIWLSYAAEARRRGLDAVTDSLAHGQNAEDVAAAFDKALCRALLARATAADSAIGSCAGTVIERAVARYGRVDAAFRLGLCEVAASSHLESMRRLCSSEDHAVDVSALRRVLQARGRNMSLRQVLNRFSEIVLALCPCVLATPASLAQCFGWDTRFDLLIFDEASQVETARAVGVLERARQVVVAGDPQQMPPSAFFERQNAVGFDEAAGVDALLAARAGSSSLLDDCLALGLPRVMLRWHYRSRHESLIAFSNDWFYGGRLRTFPSPDDRQSKVRFCKVEGVYEGGGVNHAEAEAIVTEVRRRFEQAETDEDGCEVLGDGVEQRYPSLGIVTFNVCQQALIEKLLDDEFARDAAFASWAQDGPDPLEVRNLESVQGDEHDAILLSVAYGPDANGRVVQRFGPLNVAGGERRLNVAITRARCEMLVFSSMTADCIDASRDASGGVAALKGFLAYAQSCSGSAVEGDLEDGSISLEGRKVSAAVGMRPEPAADPLAQSLAEALRARGWQAECGVGASELKVDVAVLDPSCPSCYLLGILFDGPSFCAARTTHDRYVGRDEVLAGLGWNLAHVWSIDCLTGLDREVRRLTRRLEKIIPS